MDKVTQLKNAIEFAKQNPDSPQSIQLRRRIETGMYNRELEQIKNPPLKERSKYEVAMGIGEDPNVRLERQEKILDFTGGKILAQGLGQALANPEISKNLEETQKSQFEIQGNLINKIKEKKANKEDTSRLENALKLITEDIGETGQGAEKLLNQKEITTKQVLGDALQLATTASAGKLTQGVGQLTSKIPVVGQGIGVVKGATKGLITGTGSGATFGALQGTASGLKENEDIMGIAGSAVKGAVIGGALGGTIGTVIGGVTGKLEASKILKDTVTNHLKTAKIEFQNMPDDEILALGGKGKLLTQNKNDIVMQLRDAGLTKQAKALEAVDVSKLDNIDDYSTLIKDTITPSKITKNALNAITPNTKDLTPTEYEKLLSKGKIIPKTKTQPSRYVLSEQEKATALKYKDILTNDPVKNTQNIIEEIAKKDAEVGDFLRKNNSIFNKGELKNNLTKKLEEFDDLLVSDEKLAKAKQSVVDNFIKSLKKNNMESLWKARKEFDRQIENAFKGSPSLSKEIKKGFRNAIQDFIAEKTPNNTYKSAMKEMSQLFNLKDVTNQKAITEKGMNAIQLWVKRHPTRTKAITALLGTGVLTGIGASLLKD